MTVYCHINTIILLVTYLGRFPRNCKIPLTADYRFTITWLLRISIEGLHPICCANYAHMCLLRHTDCLLCNIGDLLGRFPRNCVRYHSPLTTALPLRGCYRRASPYVVLIMCMCLLRHTDCLLCNIIILVTYWVDFQEIV